MCIDQSLNPATVRPLPRTFDPYDRSIIKISAYRTLSDEYLVEFVLEDIGHFGMYGVIYSEAPVSHESTPDGQRVNGYYLIDGGDRQIAKYWWFAYNNNW